VGEVAGNEDENSAAAAVPDQGWEDGVGDVFGSCWFRVRDELEGEARRPMEDCEGRQWLKKRAYWEFDTSREESTWRTQKTVK
jgi:hypothetical protein